MPPAKLENRKPKNGTNARNQGLTANVKGRERGEGESLPIFGHDPSTVRRNAKVEKGEAYGKKARQSLGRA